jgi:hypothetical protein
MRFRLLGVICALALASSSFAALTWNVGQEIQPYQRFFQMHGSVIHNGKLYVMGGNTGMGDIDKMYYATLTGPGTVSSFTTCTATLPHGATPTQADFAYIERKVLSYNGRIYIVGGNNNSTDPERNQVTVITPDASGDIQASGIVVSNVTGNPIDRLEASAVVNPATGKLYVIGGRIGSVSQSLVDVAQINADGSVGPFTTAGTLAAPTAFAGAVLYNGKIYVVGGYTTTGIATVQQATVNADGTLGAFTTGAALPQARTDGGLVVYQNKLYYAGGCVSGNADTKKDVFVAPMDASGNITGWTTDSQVPVMSTMAGSTFPKYDGPTTGLRRISTVASDANGIFVTGGRIDSATWTGFVFIGRDTSGVSEWSLY